MHFDCCRQRGQVNNSLVYYSTLIIDRVAVAVVFSKISRRSSASLEEVPGELSDVRWSSERKAAGGKSGGYPGDTQFPDQGLGRRNG